MRNRQQRMSSEIYRLVPLFEEEGKESPLKKGAAHHIEGSLENFEIVSVPSSTTYASAKILQKELTAALNKPVLIITHNTTFMTVEKLKPKDASEVLKRFEGAKPLVIPDGVDPSEAVAAFREEQGEDEEG